MSHDVHSKEHLETRLYFESHITIEPVLDEGRRRFLRSVAENHGFKLAELLMQKRPDDTPERSKYDTFMTARSGAYLDLLNRTRTCVADLHFQDFKVWRAKIENTLFDTRHGDPMEFVHDDRRSS